MVVVWLIKSSRFLIKVKFIGTKSSHNIFRILRNRTQTVAVETLYGMAISSNGFAARIFIKNMYNDSRARTLVEKTFAISTVTQIIELSQC